MASGRGGGQSADEQVTRQAPLGDADCLLMLDADLATLGTSAAGHDRYAQSTREEYAWVSESDSHTGRRRMLDSFLGRKRLYYTDALLGQREQMARVNLCRETDARTCAGRASG